MNIKHYYNFYALMLFCAGEVIWNDLCRYNYANRCNGLATCCYLTSPALRVGLLGGRAGLTRQTVVYLGDKYVCLNPY